MNAYELADINDWSCCAHVKEVSAMLRQQADRIAELSKNVDELEEELLKAPQIKKLSDEEIRTIQDMCHLKNVGYNTFIMRFARAILKKASEK